MKLGPSSNDDGGRRPGHILGRVRTSTAALIVAFIALFWVYQTVQPEPVGSDAPTQVVPPGFVPDPNYTWVPRTNVRRPKEPAITTTRRRPPTDDHDVTRPGRPARRRRRVRRADAADAGASRVGADANADPTTTTARRTRTGAHHACSAEIA